MPLVKQRVFAAMREANFAGPEALAKKAGIAASTIHRIGQGNPDIKTLEAIAKATGKTVDWLLGRAPASPDLLVNALNRNSNMIEALVVMLARREGITLHDLAESETAIVDQIAAAAGQASASEAMRQGQSPAPGELRLPVRTPRELQSAKP